MEYVLIAITVLFGAGMTFFSGFGLGTLMLPVFSLFFDVPVAIGATAIVHLSNNLFKFLLVRKHIATTVYFRFGIPAMLFAIIGGYILSSFSSVDSFYSYSIGSKTFQMTYMNVIIGMLMIFFAWFDLNPKYSELKVSEKHLPLGGALSGFFGGISGHQGAFRSVFLSKSGLTKEQFVGTSNAVSLTVDIARIPVYLGLVSVGSSKQADLAQALSDGSLLLVVGIVFAFLGTFFGKKFIHKTTIKGVQQIIGVLLFLMGGMMIAGVI